MKKQNPKPRFRLEDMAKIPESTIKLFKEVTSKKRIIQEIIYDENIISSSEPEYTPLGWHVPHFPDDGPPQVPDICSCNYYI